MMATPFQHQGEVASAQVVGEPSARRIDVEPVVGQRAPDLGSPCERSLASQPLCLVAVLGRKPVDHALQPAEQERRPVADDAHRQRWVGAVMLQGLRPALAPVRGAELVATHDAVRLRP